MCQLGFDFGFDRAFQLPVFCCQFEGLFSRTEQFIVVPGDKSRCAHFAPRKECSLPQEDTKHHEQNQNGRQVRPEIVIVNGRLDRNPSPVFEQLAVVRILGIELLKREINKATRLF